MLYKIATILGVVFLSLQPSDLYSMEEKRFNPESVKFSQKRTLKTWLAERHQNDPDQLNQIQKNVATIGKSSMHLKMKARSILTN